MLLTRSRGRALAAATALLTCAALPSAARADSIVHVFEHNVWLAEPDGSGRYQVTTDGTPADPYRSPSQADDGTIAVGKGQEIVRMRQNGEVLNRIDPAPLKNSAGQPVDGPPVSVAISPDGARIAYTLVGYSCPVAADCAARGVTAYTAADRLTPAAEGGVPFRWQQSWVTNTRTLVFGGYLGQVNVHDVGQPAEVHWFDDQDMHADSTDLNDGELSRDGTKLALVRGYAGNQFGNAPHIVTYAVNGNVQTGPPPANPTAKCVTGQEPAFHSPTWAPDGVRLAWGMSQGIEVHADPMNCAAPITLVLPGAGQPDWGPAAIAPGPRPGAGGGGEPGGGGGGGGPTPPAPGGSTAKRATLSVTRPGSIRTVAAKGLRLVVRCRSACRISGRLRVDATTAKRLKLGRQRTIAATSARLRKAGTKRLTLKVARKADRRFSRLARAKVTVQVRVTGAGAPQTLRKTMTLRRR
jgi:hypothetical protein